MSINNVMELQKMPSKVIKRDGRKQPFDPSKITYAIDKAFAAIGERNQTLSFSLTYRVVEKIVKEGLKEPTVPQIQQLVENTLMEEGLYENC